MKKRTTEESLTSDEAWLSKRQPEQWRDVPKSEPEYDISDIDSVLEDILDELRLIRAAAQRLLAYRPLAENAKGRAGLAVGEDETHEQDGELPWVEGSAEN